MPSATDTIAATQHLAFACYTGRGYAGHWIDQIPTQAYLADGVVPRA